MKLSRPFVTPSLLVLLVSIGDEFPPVCGAMRMKPSTPGLMRLGGRSETMETLATNLTGPEDSGFHPVVDRTGLIGGFDLSLEWRPDFPQSGANSQPRPDGPTIQEAMKEQLGLKLDATKGPITVLVVDHVEEPSPN